MHLNDATTPIHQQDNGPKIKQLEAEIARIEVLLDMPGLESYQRDGLHTKLLRASGTLNRLRQPPEMSTGCSGRMKSFVGLDPYYFNG
jgi:hypothetical protein